MCMDGAAARPSCSSWRALGFHVLPAFPRRVTPSQSPCLSPAPCWHTGSCRLLAGSFWDTWLCSGMPPEVGAPPQFSSWLWVLCPCLAPQLDVLPENRIWVLGGFPSTRGPERARGTDRQCLLTGHVSSVPFRWTFTAGCVGRTVTARSSGKATSPQRSTKRRFSTPKTTSTAGSTASQRGILVFVIGT